MNRLKQNKLGLGAVEVLLVIVTIGILGFTGWFVLHAKHTADKTLDANNSTLPAKTANTTDQTQKTQGQYLVFKEWGVSLLYSNSDTFTYTLVSNGQSAEIGSAALAKEDSGCTNNGAGVIERFAPTDSASPYGGDPTVAESAKENPGSYISVGGYYYLFKHSQTSCGPSVSGADQNMANDTIKASLAQLQVTNSN